MLLPSMEMVPNMGSNHALRGIRTLFEFPAGFDEC